MIKKNGFISVVFVAFFMLLIIDMKKLDSVQESHISKMIGESFCLTDEENKSFYRLPKRINKVYGYDKSGKEIVFKENIDYMVDYKKGTISRTKTRLYLIINDTMLFVIAKVISLHLVLNHVTQS